MALDRAGWRKGFIYQPQKLYKSFVFVPDVIIYQLSLYVMLLLILLPP